MVKKKDKNLVRKKKSEISLISNGINKKIKMIIISLLTIVIVVVVVLVLVEGIASKLDNLDNLEKKEGLIVPDLDYTPEPSNVPSLDEMLREVNSNLGDGNIVPTKPQMTYTPKPSNVPPLEE